MWTRWNELGFGGLDGELSALNDLRNQMDRLFLDFERGRGQTRPSRGENRSVDGSSWPRIMLHDAGHELRLRAEVPGIGEKDLEISIEQSSLTIRGERRVEALEGYSVHRQERGNRTLPCRVDTERTTAKLVHGVLEMTLPKVAAEQPRQIQIQAS